METMWGIHNDVFGQELIEGGFVSIGWDEVPDLTTIGPDREALKDLLRERGQYREQAVRNAAGVLYRFGFEMNPGDIVVAPNKADGTLSFGTVTGPYYFDANAPSHRHRRPVQWLKTGVSRSHFSVKALAEIGSQLTQFRISTNDTEFRAFIEASPEDEHLFEGQRHAPAPGDPVRYDLAVHAALLTLDEVGLPVPRPDMLARVSARLDGVWTDYEAAPFRAGDPTPRWQNGFMWSSTDMRGAGWIDKTPAGWVLTDAGRAALTAHPDGQGLAREASRLYKLALDEKRPRPRHLTAIDAALGLIPPGRWTSYTDLAMAVGTNAQTVGWYMGQTTAEGTHRVLGHDGKPSPGFVWPEATPRDETQREALEAEGVAFDEGGRADEARRVHTGDIRADLEANGVLTAPTRRAWLVREATTGNHDQVPDWFTEGHVALRASSLREVEAGLSRDELKAIVAEDYSSSAYSAKATKVDDLHAFLSTCRWATSSPRRDTAGCSSAPSLANPNTHKPAMAGPA